MMVLYSIVRSLLKPKRSVLVSQTTLDQETLSDVVRALTARAGS